MPTAGSLPDQPDRRGPSAPTATTVASTAAPTAPSSVAIVMPAHRPGDDLRASLAALAGCVPAPDEFVVVVDGGDTAVLDDVRTAVTGPVADRVTTVSIPASGPATARNVGVASTTADLVLFVDSDVVVRPDLVDAVRSALRDPDVHAIIGSYDDRPGTDTTVSQFRNLLHHWTHQRSAGPGHTFWGACGAIRRHAFESVDGFDETYRDATIEDIELGERLTRAGFHIEVVPTIQVTHLKRWTLTGMVHTDVTKRGIPWTRLMLADRSMGDDLNTTRAARVTVALAGVASALALSLAFRPGQRPRAVATVAAAVALTWRDRAVLGFLRRRRSTSFALRCVPLLWIHHVSAGVAFAWALATWPLVRRRRRPAARTPPTPLAD